MPREPKQLPIPSMMIEVPATSHESFVLGPNPQLPDFVRRHSRPYDPKTDQYGVPPFDRDIVVDKACPPKVIYDMHTYWSKKHWAAIREYLRHYLPGRLYPPGTGLVLDCFSGSGMTGVATMMEGRPCVLVDASPAAVFLSHCYTHPVDPAELEEAYGQIMTKEYPEALRKKLKRITGEEIGSLKQELDWLYATRCDRCGGAATTEYVVYSERFQCRYCNQIVALDDCPEIRVQNKARYCPHCLAKNDGHPHKDFAISTRSKKLGAIPVKVVYHCAGKCKPKRSERFHDDDKRTRKGKFFLDEDVRRLNQIEAAELPHPYPLRRMMDIDSEDQPWGVKWRAGSANFRTVAELYTRRSLWALSAYEEQRHRLYPSFPVLDIPLTGSSLSCSTLLTEKNRQITKGTYYVPLISRAIKLNNALDYRFKILRGAQTGLISHSRPGSDTCVSNQSAVGLTLPPNSLDYVFVDPPYLNLEVQYGEMNFIWESWLGLNSDWFKQEITLNPIRGLTWATAEYRLRESMSRVYAALKPGHFASICYHDTSERNWGMLQDILLDVGFEILTVNSLDPKQKSQKQLTGEKVVKSDLVLNCRKLRPGEVQPGGHVTESDLVSNRVREVLVETLSKVGGQSRDKLWDAILKRLLARGQMAEHRFDDILAGVAFRSESGRWFLKEEFDQLSQSDIRNEEDAGAALARFAHLRSEGVPAQLAAHIALQVPKLGDADVAEREIEDYVRAHLIDDPVVAKKFRLSGRMKGIEFYDCLFFYLTRYLKGRSGGKTPRRNLAEFMEEYLVRFKDGDKWLYRPPDRAESESLKKSRETGLGRRIRQYCAFLQGEGDIPKEKMPDAKTMIAWLKHCAAFGLADEGVLLFEKGGLAGQIQQLGEDDRYDAEDYYSQCKRKASKQVDEDEEPDIEAVEAEEDEE